MRRPWSWLGVVVMGFLIGPDPIAAEPDDAEAIETERGSPKTSGHAVGGIGFYVWDEDARTAEDWALTLAQSPGEQQVRWRAIAERSAVLSSVSVSERELAFATRVADTCEGSGLTPLGLLLCLLPSLDRTYLISSLATSSDERVRLALARALAAPFQALGVDWAIRHLEEDPSPDVARQARIASVARAAPLV
jgi:hypothetical protein